MHNLYNRTSHVHCPNWLISFPITNSKTWTKILHLLMSWRSQHRIRISNRRPGFESRQGIRFFRKPKQCCCVHSTEYVRIVFVEKRNKGMDPKVFFNPPFCVTGLGQRRWPSCRCLPKTLFRPKHFLSENTDFRGSLPALVFLAKKCLWVAFAFVDTSGIGSWRAAACQGE
jgi:hypothetical protein